MTPRQKPRLQAVLAPGVHKPNTIFYLIPLNDEAEYVVKDNRNKQYLAITKQNKPVLDIGFYIQPMSQDILATIGRGKNVDIVLTGRDVARTQCSFVIDDLETGVVMLHDQSATKCTQVYGPVSQSFQCGRDRKIVIRNGFNTEIGMGGTNCDKIRFKIEWLVETDEDIVEMIKSQKDPLFNTADDPREFRTLRDTSDAHLPTALPSRGMSRMGSPGFFKMRYINVRYLGSGAYGVVSKAIDIDTGLIMAVKSIKRRGLSWSPQEYEKIRREAETMQKIAHAHIIDMITCQGWKDPCIEIFMGLKDGSLADIINANEFDDKMGSRVLEHMLAALDCLAWNKIIHRDVKPQNILYTRTSDSNYDFQLADFGECKMTSSARSRKGTREFMAPEVRNNSGVLLTPKVDIWSLFVTMVYAFDACDYRHKLREAICPEIALEDAALRDPRISSISAMGVREANHRASAAQMLVLRCGGKGLTTPREGIPEYVGPALPAHALFNASILDPGAEDTMMIDAGSLTPISVKETGRRTKPAKKSGSPNRIHKRAKHSPAHASPLRPHVPLQRQAFGKTR